MYATTLIRLSHRAHQSPRPSAPISLKCVLNMGSVDELEHRSAGSPTSIWICIDRGYERAEKYLFSNLKDEAFDPSEERFNYFHDMWDIFLGDAVSPLVVLRKTDSPFEGDWSFSSTEDDWSHWRERAPMAAGDEGERRMSQNMIWHQGMSRKST